MVYKCFDKKTGSGVTVNEQLAEKLHKPVIKKIKRRKVYARFKGNIWAADLGEMRSLFSKNKNDSLRVYENKYYQQVYLDYLDGNLFED